MRSILSSSVLVATLAALCIGGGEVLWLYLVDRSSLSAAGGIKNIAPPLLGIVLGAGAAVGLIQGLGLAALESVANKLGSSGRQSRLSWRCIPYVVALTPAIVWLCVEATSGSWIRTLPAIGLLTVAAALCLVGCAYALVWLIFWTAGNIEKKPTWRRRRVVYPMVAALAGLAFVFFLMDQTILVHFYEFFHVTLRAAVFVLLECALAAVAMFAFKARQWLPTGRRDLAAVCVLVLGTTLGTVSLNHARNAASAPLRAVIYQHSTVAATLLDMGRRLPLQPGPHNDVIPADTMVAIHGAVDQPSPPLVDPRTLTAGFGADILIITIDTLRADHLGLYGNPTPLSPHLDALAAESIVFDRAYTPSPYTACALPSLVVGMPFCVLARMGKSEGHQTIADVMARSGYKSVAFVRDGYFPPGHPTVKSYGDRKFGFGQLWGERPSDPAQTDRTVSFLAGQTSLDQKLLTWIHYEGAHNHHGHFDEYKAKIRAVDHEVGRLIAHVRRTRPRTIIAVASDHGEEFGEHGGTKHGHALYEESVRVPLIVYVPGTHARRIARPVSITALFSTLVLAAAGPSADPRLVQQVGAEDAPVVATISRRTPSTFRQTQAMVVVGDQKLICHLERDYCQLFDLESDPGERTDVAPHQADRVRQLREPLAGWLQLEQ